MSANQDVQAKLKALLEGYCAHLPERLREIDLLWQSVSEKGFMGDQGQELYRMVHSLAGSGASFGFTGLSQAAKAFELQIKAVCEGDGVFDAAVQSAIEPSRRLFYKAVMEAVENGGDEAALLSR